jgi:hypothetical protein
MHLQGFIQTTHLEVNDTLPRTMTILCDSRSRSGQMRALLRSEEGTEVIDIRGV